MSGRTKKFGGIVAEKNTPELWDRAWGREVTPEQDAFNRAREESGVRWKRTRRLIEQRLGGFDDAKVIELGAGAGTVAACMAALGAHVTVLDFSTKALSRSREFFTRAGITGDFVEADALAMPPEHQGTYDISMSYGLAEHFTGEERQRIIEAHLRTLRPGGVTLISVPNAANPPYRVYKVLAELAGFWGSGEEYPFHRRELETMMNAMGVTDFGFFGDSFSRSWDWLNPVRIGRKLLKRSDTTDVTRIRPERESGLDERWSYALVLWAVKGDSV